MEIDFDSYDKDYAKYEEIYLEIANKAFKYLKLKFNAIISVSIVNKDSIHEINKTYRNIDRETDVISFAFLDNEDRKIAYKSKAPVALGDIYICKDVALEHAKEYGNSNEREMKFLFVHGLLHLLGYDHMKKEDEEIMFPLQEEILAL